VNQKSSLAGTANILKTSDSKFFMASRTLSIGVIGAGRIGKIHAENIARRLPGAQLAGVADVNLAAAQELADHLHSGFACGDYRELLSRPGLDAVAICSATNTHADIIEAAAAGGKHVFCEKPIDLDLTRIKQALAAVAKANVRFQVGFNRRFDPSFAKVRELVAAGKIGTPHILRITSRDPAPPPISYVKVSGGIFLDMTIHDFDMTRFMSGSEVEEVHVLGASLVDPEIGRAGDIDTCIIGMRLRNGMLATIDNSRQAVYGYDQRVEVFGSGGMLTVSNRTPDNHILLDSAGVHSSKPQHFFLDRYAESYVIELQAFVDAVLNNRTPPVTGNDGLAPVLIGLAAKRSLETKRPVQLSEVSA
jgi:myo-inositol 2-dehydrogenase/D-chiro-inositol 1-dehydrogenase